MTLCTGSFGSNRANDLVAMAKEFGPRIHFAHLRNMQHEPDGSFYEADHLEGDGQLIARRRGILMTRRTRRAKAAPTPRSPCARTTAICSATTSARRSNPGYSYIGRLKGLAELRGVIRTLEATRTGRPG